MYAVKAISTPTVRVEEGAKIKRTPKMYTNEVVMVEMMSTPGQRIKLYFTARIQALR